MDEMQEKLNNLLESFDNPSRRFSEAEVGDALNKLCREIKVDPSTILFPIQAEAIAFGLCEDYKNEKSGWGTYYGPMFSGTYNNGEHFETPSIRQITSEVLGYWCKRLELAKSPIFRCRYADLIWDFTKPILNENPDVYYAKVAIDMTLLIVSNRLHPFETVLIAKLKRALDLALRTNDAERIRAVCDEMINLEDSMADDHKCGSWGFSFDCLVDRKKKLVSGEQEQKLINQLEARLLRTANDDKAGSLDPFAAESAALRLARYFRRLNKNDDIRRVLHLYAQAFTIMSQNADGMVGSSWLKKVYDVFLDFGMREDADSLNPHIRDLAKKSSQELKRISTEIKISDEDLKKFVDDMTKGTLNEALTRIFFYFLPDPSKAEKEIQELAKKTPLQFLIRQVIQDEEGRPIAEIGPYDKDIEGHIVKHISQDMRISALFLREVMMRLTDQDTDIKNSIMDYLYSSPIYDPDYRMNIEIGIDAYVKREYFIAVHVLIPAIENTLRRLLMMTGGPIYKPHRKGGLLLRNLDEILRDNGVINVLGERGTEYLKIVLTDQRGWNLRHDIVHGIQRPETFGTIMCDRIFHVLLLLAQIRAQQQ